MLRLPNSLALLGLVACANAPDELGCTDAPCREAIIIAAHDQAPTEVLDHLAALSDDLERIGVISALVDHDPEGAQVYCTLLPRGISRRRCTHIMDRPHLWTAVFKSEAGASRAGLGPVGSGFGPSDMQPSALIHIRGVSSDLEGEVDPHATAWGRAVFAAAAGDIPVAAKACASIKAGQRWRYDCFFSAAEDHVTAWDRSHLKDTIALCGAAGDFRGLCLSAVIDALAGRSPGSDVGDPLDWAPVMMRAHDLRNVLSDRALARDAMDQFWALVTAHSAAKATALSGDMFNVLPSAAAPHVRAAIAAKVLGTLPGPVPIGDAVALLSTVFERRAGAEYAPEAAQRLGSVSDLWPVDREGESHLAAVSYLGQSRRTLASDPDTDTVLVILEAAARLGPPWVSLLDQAQLSRDQRVRWTAARLVEQLGAAALGVGPGSHREGRGAPN